MRILSIALCFVLSAVITTSATAFPVSGHSADSLSTWEARIAAHPDSLDLHNQYIKTVGLDNPALELQYRQWSEQFPSIATVPYAIGGAMASAYDYRAKDWLLRAVEIDPKLADAWLKLSFDAERWGDEAQGSYFMGKAAEAEPDNPDYAFYFASSFKTVKPDEYVPRMLQVVARFPETERAPQALYWLANRAQDVEEKEAFYIRSKNEFPPSKFRWSASSMGDYFGLLLKHDPARAVQLAEEMIQQLERTDSWETNLDIARQVTEARRQLASGNGAVARDVMMQPKKGRLYGIEETLALLTTESLWAAGDTRRAFDSLLNYNAKSPSRVVQSRLAEYGSALGMSAQDVRQEINRKMEAIAEPATRFDLERYDGPEERLRLVDLRGKVVLVTYWFPGCGPCRGEFPHFENVLAKFDRDDVSYVGINISPKEDPYVLPFMEASGHSFIPVKDDPENRGNLPARGAPTNYLIDRNGNILYKNFMIGANNEEMLELMIEQALALPVQEVTISGTVTGPWEGHSVNLYNNVTGDEGSAEIVDGKFELTVPYSIPTRQMLMTTYDLQVKGGYAPFGILVERPGKIHVELDIEKGFATGAAVSGSAPHEIYAGMLTKLRDAHDEEERQRILAGTVRDHADSYAAVFILDRHGRDLPVTIREELFSGLDNRYASLREWERIADKISGDKSAEVGAEVTNFTLLTPEDQPLSFDQFEGKYVYLNFWASWCGPCHQEFPQLEEIYAAYKDQGFEVLGVSTDKNKDAWLKDLEKIQLPWPQVRDGEGDESIALRQFGVTALPTSFLIGPDGKILAKGLRVAQLEEELKKVVEQNKISYTIEGEIEGLREGMLYFTQFVKSGKMDSTQIEQGKFRFAGSLSEPSPVILSLEKNFVNKPLFMLFVDNGLHTVRLDAANLRQGRVTGSSASADFARLEELERPFDEQLVALREGKAEGAATVINDRKAAYEQFIRAHPHSPVAAWVAQRHFGFSAGDLRKLEEFYEMLPPSLHYTSYVQEMKTAIDKSKMLAIGQVAPDFIQQDTSGRDVALSDFRGKYVLLDFWASWCGPCRADNPNIVKAFEAYKDRGFTVLGVSLDGPRQRDAWIKAIHDDGLHWTNVSDLGSWDNAVARQYGIRSIPSNFLIGPDGKILARNLRGDQLSKELEKLIGRQ